MNELRIGNYYWIGYAGKYAKITGFIPKSTNYQIEEGFPFTGYLIEGCEKLIGWDYEPEPILLTEEWLLKFGYINTIKSYWSNGSLEIRLNDNFVYEFLISSDRSELLELLYVHQLQNLYFTLIQNELILE